jgi:hypothetical protein
VPNIHPSSGGIQRQQPGPALAPRVDLDLLPKHELDEGLILAASQQREEAADECEGEDSQSPHDCPHSAQVKGSREA